MKKRKHRPYNQLKTALQVRRISYRDLSRFLCISETAVSNKINGKSDFFISEAARIEDAFLIPRSVFLPGEFR